MRRKHRKIQAVIDAQGLDAIRAGRGDHKSLTDVVKSVMFRLSLEDLFDRYAKAEASNLKQRLRTAGEIEIGSDGVAKTVGTLTPADIETISTRRKVDARGLIRGCAKFEHSHGRMANVQMFLRMYAAMAPDDAKSLSEELNVTF